jgi:hypothetical protein
MPANLRYRDDFTQAEKMAYNRTRDQLLTARLENEMKKNMQDAQEEMQRSLGGGYEEYTANEREKKRQGVNTTTLDSKVALMTMWDNAGRWGKMLKEALFKEHPELFLPVLREPLKKWAKEMLQTPTDYVMNTNLSIPDLEHSASIDSNGQIQLNVNCKDRSKNEDHKQMLVGYDDPRNPDGSPGEHHPGLRDLYADDFSEWLTQRGYTLNGQNQVVPLAPNGRALPNGQPMTPQDFEILRDDTQPGRSNPGPNSFAAFVSQKWGRLHLEEKNEQTQAAAPVQPSSWRRI